MPPQNKNTVREIIKSSLTVQRQTDAIQGVLNGVVADLRKTAEIKVFTDNLNW